MSATTAGVTPSGGLSRRRGLAALLAVSLVLNLCFVAGALWSRYHGPAASVTTTERFRKLAETLDLTPQQRAAYDAYVGGLRTRGDRLRQDIDPLIDAAWAEIAKTQPDQARVLDLFEQVGTRRRAYQQEAVSATLALLALLTPEQRGKFIASENERHLAARRRLNESR